MGWIPDVAPGDPISSTAWGNVVRDRVVQVFDSDAERNADAVVRPGMMAWTEAEAELAVWIAEDPGWVVLIERWHPWTPAVFFGGVNWPIAVNEGSYFRRSFGAVEIYSRCQVNIASAPAAGDILIVVPPFTPAGEGDFGVFTVAREGVGWLGNQGAYNGDENRLGCLKMGGGTAITAGIVVWDDLAAGTGNLIISLKGSYPTGQFSSG